MIAIPYKTSSNLRHDGCFFTKRAIAAGGESQSQIAGHSPNPSTGVHRDSTTPSVRAVLLFYEPTDSGAGVSPARTRRPTHGRDARATSFAPDRRSALLLRGFR